jgi:hypothetical protein
VFVVWVLTKKKKGFPADLVSNSLISVTIDIVDEDRFNLVADGNVQGPTSDVNLGQEDDLAPFPPSKTPKNPRGNPFFQALLLLQLRLRSTTPSSSSCSFPECPFSGFNIFSHLLDTQDDKKQALMWKPFEQHVLLMVGNFNFFVNNEWIFDTHTFQTKPHDHQKDENPHTLA